MYREPTMMGRKLGHKPTGVDQKEEINIQPKQNEETRIQKYEESLRNFWDNFKCSSIQIIRVPKGEQEE